MKNELKLKVLIVDDEPEARKAIEILLNDFANIFICASTGNVKDIPELMQKENPDLILLDIQMPEKDGFMVLQEIRSKHFDPFVIFTTAYDQYALKAIKAGAFEYLLKPINRLELRQVIEKVIRLLEDKNLEARIANLEKVITQSNQKIRFNTRSGFLLIHPNDVLFIEADANYSEVHISNQKCEIVSMNLGQVQKILPDQFIRISRSVIVNGNFITRVSGGSKQCYLKNGNEEFYFRIPEKHVAEIRKIFTAYKSKTL